jgi:ABC-2 type transport system permease protein
MSDQTISDVRAGMAERNSPRAPSLADHPLVQLTLVRFLEFVREPEALFWVFVFPLLLAAGLGIAFRNRPAEVLKIAVAAPELAQSLRQEKLLDVQQMNVEAAQEALRTGKVALLAVPGPGGTVEYRYDDTNPEGRAARLLADRAIQKAAGRVDPVATSDVWMREPGSRYIDFLIPGLLGMNLMGSAIWSMGFAIVDARRKKLLKRLVASPMPRPYYLLSFLLSRILLLVAEVGVLVGFGALFFHVPVRGSLADLAVLCVLSSLSFAACSFPRKNSPTECSRSSRSFL